MTDNRKRYTVAEAARKLGISEAAVRQRVGRGSIPSERDEHGNRWVLLPAASAEDHDPSDDSPDERTAHERELIDLLREQLREKDRQIAELHQALARSDEIAAQLTVRIRPPRFEPIPLPEWRGEDDASRSNADGSIEVSPRENAPGEAWWRRWWPF